MRAVRGACTRVILRIPGACGRDADNSGCYYVTPLIIYASLQGSLGIGWLSSQLVTLRGPGRGLSIGPPKAIALVGPDTLSCIGSPIILGLGHLKVAGLSCGTGGLQGPLCQKSIFAV